MFNYSSNFRDKISRADRLINKSSASSKIKSKITSLQRNNNPKIVDKKEDRINIPKTKDPQSIVVDQSSRKIDNLTQGNNRQEIKTQVGFKEDPISVYKELYLDEIQKQSKNRYEIEQKEIDIKRLNLEIQEIQKENENLKRQKVQRDDLIEQLTKQNELH